MSYCKKCSKPIPTDRLNPSSGVPRVYCSKRCYDLWHGNETRKRRFRKQWSQKHGMPYPMKTCLECGLPFNAMSKNGKTQAKRCSSECKKAALTRQQAEAHNRRPKKPLREVTGVCWYCHSSFTVKQSRGRIPLCCSPECELHRKRALRFKLNRQEYKDLSAKCEICGDVADAIDHCHDSGEVRGHLCKTCNSGLGFFHDNTYLLQAAIKYLESKQAAKI